MMDFLAFLNNATLLLALSLLSSNIQFRWLKKEPLKSIVLGAIYGLFAVIAMSNPMELRPGVFFDGRSVILSLAGLFSGNLTTILACLIAAAARFYIGGQGVFTGIGSIFISGLAGVVFKRIAEKKATRLDPAKLFSFGFYVHLILVLWFFTFPSDIAISVIKNVALPYLVVFPLTTMFIGNYMKEQEQRIIVEKNLAESEKRFRDLVNTLNEGVWEVNSDYVTTFVNPKMASMLGYRSDEMVGKLVYDFIPERLHPIMDTNRARRLQGIREQFEINLIGKDGKELTFLVGSTPLLDERGQFRGSLAGIQNITELKQAQARLEEQSRTLEEKVEERTQALKDAQEQLLKAEKMAALGEMAGSVGHELRNPLAVIANSLYLLKNKTSKLDKQTIEYVNMIESETLNASRIINDLLDYSRIQAVPKKEVNLSAWLAEVILKTAFPKNIEVKNNVKEDLPAVSVNPQQLEQILDNLISNAVEAMPDGGSLEFSSTRSKEGLLIHVEDSGCGIPPENLERIFEPLFTTKARGVGLGLAITCKLAELNGIAIRVKSQVGKGTKFTLVFKTGMK